MRHKIDKTEERFLHAFLGDEPLEKDAVDLDPSVAEALGIPTVSPAILDQLEEEAAARSKPPTRRPAPQQQQQQATQSPTQAPPTSEETTTAPSQPVEEAEPDVVATEPAPAETMDVAGFDPDDPPPAEEETLPQPELPNRTTHGKLFTNKRAHPLQILDVLTARYGTEWTEWEPETLWWALRRDFGPVGELARNKIGALRVAVTTDLPWLDWDVFEDSGLTWNDTIPIIGAFQPMTPAQTAFTVQILRAIRSDEPFDTEVKAYIAAILEEHGFVYAPKEYFDGAQELLDRKVWLAGFRQQVAMAWERIKDVDPTTIEWNYDNALDIHLLKLMVVKHYVDERMALREKVPGVPSSTSTASPPVP